MFLSLCYVHRSIIEIMIEEKLSVFLIFYYENRAVRNQVTIFFANVFAVDD